MTGPAYSPLVETYPTTPADLLAFAQGIPDAGQRRLGIAIASAMQSAADAMTAARNARQMILNRDPRFDTLDERIAALGTLTDAIQAQQVELEQAQTDLQALAASYQAALTASSTDRQTLHTQADQLRTDLTTQTGRIDTANSNITAEITRAQAAEAAALKAATDEATRAKAAETALGTRTTALETRAGTIESAATTLATRVTAAEAKNTAQDTSIAANASNIGALQTSVTNEITARTNADTALGARIDALTARVTTIKTIDEPPFIVGQVYGTSGGAFTYTLTHGELQTARLKVPTGSAPIKGLAFEVTVAGATGRYVRLGLWADNGSGFPGALLGSGIVYPNSVGGKVLTFSTPISYVGQLHMGIRAEVATGYATTVRPPDIRGVTAFIEGVPTLMSGTSASSLVSASTATGAFAASPSMVPDIGGGPRLTLVF